MRRDNELLILENQRRYTERMRYMVDSMAFGRKAAKTPHKPLQGKFSDYLTTLTEGDERKCR